jgi:hypothetical protein
MIVPALRVVAALMIVPTLRVVTIVPGFGAMNQ